VSTLSIIAENNKALRGRYLSRLQVNRELKRTLVSFQANKTQQGYRWFKYKEGYSSALVEYVFRRLGLSSGRVLDPFAGSGTTLFVASQLGMDAVGIELLPVGSDVMRVRQDVLNDDSRLLQAKLHRWITHRPWMTHGSVKPFPHLRITSGAFPSESEEALGRYLAASEGEEDGAFRHVLRFAALCILEEISFTRKDGQYLRWDHRSGRRQGAKPFDKGAIKPFDEAIEQKLRQIHADLCTGKEMLDLDFGFSPARSGNVQIVEGSSLAVLPTLASNSFDCLMTSPPYCNRYDYTRTYALELALLGVNEDEIRRLRQTMLSCTVENRDKPELRELFSASTFARASEAFDRQQDLQTTLAYLEQCKADKTLNNSGIPRMIRNYFFEMALVIFEAARVLKPGAPFVMVNDNVRYGGANIDVDLILSDIAQRAGFDVETIWVLPVGKGNSSQQMGEHGREELRKCVYVWRRSTK